MHQLDFIPGDTLTREHDHFKGSGVLDADKFNYIRPLGQYLGDSVFNFPIDIPVGYIGRINGFDYFYNFSTFYPDDYQLVYTHSANETWGNSLQLIMHAGNKKIEVIQAAIFPNPSAGNFTVQLPESMQLNNLTAINIAGISVLLTCREGASGELIINSVLPDGIYTLLGTERDGAMVNLGKINIVSGK